MDFQCRTFHLAKQTRLAFLYNNKLSSSTFDLMHLGVWCPFQTVSVKGYRYFLTIVNDCSRFTWINLLHTKPDVQAAIPQFFDLVFTQFGKIIKGVRSSKCKGNLI